jgi:hypothetical protein
MKEAQFLHELGLYIAIFTTPDFMQLGRNALFYGTLGRRIGLFGVPRLKEAKASFFSSLQRLTPMPTPRNKQLNLGILDGPLLAFYPQDPVTIVQIEIDPVMRESPLKQTNDMPGCRPILHIGLEDFYNFHIDSMVESDHLRSEMLMLKYGPGFLLTPMA